MGDTGPGQPRNRHGRGATAIGTRYSLIALGIWLWSAGVAINLVEEWRAKGLTFLSYRALLLMAAGPALVAYEVQHIPVIAVAVAAPAVLAVWLMSRKLRDLARTRRWL